MVFRFNVKKNRAKIMGSEASKKVQVHVPYPVLLERLEFFRDEKINPEVYMDSSHLESAAPEDLEEIKNEFASNGLTVTMHGPYIDLNPGSANEEKRRSTADRYRQVFDAIKYLRPKNVVLHGGYNEKKFHGNIGLWLEQSLKTWPEFVKRAEEYGTVIAVENIFDRTPDALAALMEAVESPNFGICIDSGHLNVFSKVDIEDWFELLGDRIAEVHLHDNHGKNDEHLPLGEGAIDFKLFFTLLKKYGNNPVYTIEPHGEEMMRRAIQAIKKFL